MIKLLECKDYSLVPKLQNQMEEAAGREAYVKAIKIRDKLYYIRGLNIMDKEIVNMKAIDTLLIEEKAKKVFEQNTNGILLNKEDIDSINIISSFIKKNRDKIFYVE